MDYIDLIKRLRDRKKSVLPKDWQKGRKCPECHYDATRPKCAFEMGGSCPRHDPANYDDDENPIYQYIPEPLCNEAAYALEELLKNGK